LPFNKDEAVILNGIPVYPLLFSGSMSPNPHIGRGGYYAPTLGAEVTAFGPMAGRVTDTLTRSPRAVVLAPGSSPVVPSSWRSATFQGLVFATPRSWPLVRTPLNYGIGQPCYTNGAVFFEPRVVLSTDGLIAALKCAQPSAEPQNPQDGLQVDTGSLPLTERGLHLAFSKHCLDLHGLTVCPATSPAYSILVLRVTVPGHSKPVYVSIGLAGNGMVARAILYSLRAA
jgi:hypothetical protein